MLSNQRHRVYPGSGGGAVRPAVVCSRHYIAQHRGACSGAATSKAGEEAWLLSTGVPVVGRLQARRERKRGSQVPGGVAEDIVGELESKCVICCVLSPSPAAGGFVPLL
jgi:hypothetical protein